MTRSIIYRKDHSQSLICTKAQADSAIIANLSFENGVRRLAGLLQSLVVSDGATIPYTIDELASIIGAHRNMVTNSLSYLRAEGYVAKQQRPIVVADIGGCVDIWRTEAILPYFGNPYGASACQADVSLTAGELSSKYVLSIVIL